MVGAGLGGLAAACHLSGAGHEVTVIERDDAPGGRAGQWQVGGYRFDTGPTVFTMVDILERTFEAAGASMTDHVSFQRLDPAYRACYADGSELFVRAGRDAMTEEIRSVCGDHDADAFGPFCDWLTELHRVEVPHFLDRNFDSPLGLASNPKAGLDLLRLGGFGKLEAKVKSYFDDERLHRLFSFQALYAGLSPFDALALYGVITYMDTVAGVWAPEGGIHAVATGLADAAEKAGTQFHYGDPVIRIERAPGNGPVNGVRTAGGLRIDADVVVANPDVPAVYRELLSTTPPWRARHGTFSPSCLLWLVGVQGDLPEATVHHNIHFGEKWTESFDELLNQGTTMSDPSILVSAPSITDPTCAPAGRHSLYVLEPVPNLDGNVDWHTEREPARERLATRLASLGYPDVIEHERLTDPLDWDALGMERGTPFAMAHKFARTGPFRAGNVDRKVPGLVLVGSGTVPGVGVPMVLLSGRLAAERAEAFGGGKKRAGRRR
ncbi:phytoene desaturase family protein [soil metagenome]